MSEQRYTVETRENGHRLKLQSITDPFITTMVRPRGWRTALQVLRGRYELEVLVSGDRERIEQVLELNPDYLGPAGSPSRTAWNAQLEQALHSFAADLPDD